MSDLILPDSVQQEVDAKEKYTFYDYKDFRCKVDRSEVYKKLEVFHGAASRIDGERGRITFTVNDNTYGGCRKQLEYVIDEYYKQSRNL